MGASANGVDSLSFRTSAADIRLGMRARKPGKALGGDALLSPDSTGSPQRWARGRYKPIKKPARLAG